ncbi:MAG: rhomboid family intramembrane serine protease [Planctomycetes bacterium]|nr:rhomboid family intramembrane serine protease [Planctomycetota bacterium]
MGYEDRDYFQSRPGIELSSGIPRGTFALLIALGVVYLSAAVVGGHLDYVDTRFFMAVQQSLGGEARSGQPGLIHDIFVLTPQDIAPFAPGFEKPAPWKLLTHWLLAPSLIQFVFTLIGVYVVGRLVEQFLGLRRFIGLIVVSSILGAVASCAVDPFILRGRLVLIMGADAGLMALFASLIWLAPDARTFFNWRLRNFVIGAVCVLVVWQTLSAAVSQGVVTSPTHGVFAIAVSAAYMIYLKKRNRLPALAALSRGGVTQSGMEPDADPLERSLKQSLEQRSDDARHEREQREANDRDRARVDTLLAKISEKGIGALSKSEKKFLDERGKKKK